MAKIRALLDKRQALYDAIPAQVRTDGLDVEAVADRVVAAYRT